MKAPSPLPWVADQLRITPNDQAGRYLFTIPWAVVRFEVLGVPWPSGTRKPISDFSWG